MLNEHLLNQLINLSRSKEKSAILGKQLQYSMFIDMRVDSLGTLKWRIKEPSPTHEVIIPYYGVSYFYLTFLWFFAIINYFF